MWLLDRGCSKGFLSEKFSIWLIWAAEARRLWELGVKLNNWGSFRAGGLADTFSSWKVDNFEVTSATSSVLSWIIPNKINMSKSYHNHSRVEYFSVQVLNERGEVYYQCPSTALRLTRWGWATRMLGHWRQIRGNAIYFICTFWYWLLYSRSNFLQLINENLYNLELENLSTASDDYTRIFKKN